MAFNVVIGFQRVGLVWFGVVWHGEPAGVGICGVGVHGSCVDHGLGDIGRVDIELVTIHHNCGRQQLHLQCHVTMMDPPESDDSRKPAGG